MRTGFLRLAAGVASALAVAVMVGVIPSSSEAMAASWRALPPAPVAGRIDASVVWTGREMIVWGGVTRTASGQVTARSDGAAYNPWSRRWRRIANAPADVLGGGGPAAVWTGSRMVVYVGNSPEGPAATAAYDPRTNTWKRLATGPLRVREQYASVWTGKELLVFGGHSGDGPATPTAAALNPATVKWRELRALDAITGLAVVNGAVWDGRQAIVAGQLYRASNHFSGPILLTFDPMTNKVRRIDLSKAPLSAFQRMSLRPLGRSGSDIVFVAGAPSSPTVVVRYNPATRRWREAQAAACKLQGQIVRAGGRLVTGCGADRVEIYNPSSDRWSTIKAGPSPLNSREGSAIAWTGTELIVWSGQTATRFNPTPGDGASLALGRAAARASASVPSARLVYERDFRTSHPSIWIARADGGRAHKLASDAISPKISPDGQLVTYIAMPVSPGARLMLVSAGGGRPRVLLRTALINVVEWSPDAKRIAVVEQPPATQPGHDQAQIVTIDVSSGRVHAIGAASLPFSVSFSPDAKRVAYTRSARSQPARDDIYVESATGGLSSRLTHDGHSMVPVWGSDSIVFVHERPAPPAPPKQDLYLVRPSGAALRRLTHEAIPNRMFGFTPIAWSANGRRLIAEWNGFGTSYVVTVDPRTGVVRRVGQPTSVTRGVAGSGLSKDGSTILGLQSDRTGNRNTVVALPYGGGAVRVLARDAIGPSWSR